MTASATPMNARRSGPLTGAVTVPGDKSISHRALMFGALAAGRTRITGLLEAADVMATAAALRALGTPVNRTPAGEWHVDGAGIGGLVTPGDILDLGNSGTGARLLAGILAGHPVRAILTGDESLRSRPMTRIIEPLSRMGAQFDAAPGGRLPLLIHGAEPPIPIHYRLPVASAQVKSAVLLAGLGAPGITSVTEPAPTRDHTERLLRAFGANVEIDNGDGAARTIHLTGEPELQPCELAIPNDPSSAAFALVAALIVPESEITVTGVALNPLRTGLFTTLIEMGADLNIAPRGMCGGEPVGDITARTSALAAITVPAARAPGMIDEYPVLAIAAACADGESRFAGLGELRHKESDRLAATADGLNALGAAARIEEDTLIIRGRAAPPPGGARIAAHGDHRIAMAFLTLGLACADGAGIDDGTMINTSFPGFAALMQSLGAAIDEA